MHSNMTIKVVLGLGPKTWTRALGKSSDQNSSRYRVLRPHCRDLKVHDLKHNCAAAYAGTCQTHIRCHVALRIGALENGVIRIWHGDLGKTILFLGIWCKFGHFGQPWATHASEACVAIKMSSAHNFRAINFWTRALRLEAPATKARVSDYSSHHYIKALPWFLKGLNVDWWACLTLRCKSSRRPMNFLTIASGSY